MNWRDGWILWIAGAIPVLVTVALVLLSRWRQRTTALFFRRSNGRESTTLEHREIYDDSRRGQPHGARGVLKGVLLTLGLGLWVAALAGPQYGSRVQLMQKRGVDLVVVMDFSRSMLARDVAPSRLDRAKAELRLLLHQLGGDRVGVVAFAGESITFPMTTDYAAVELFLRDLNPSDIPLGGTAIGRALVSAQRLLEAADGNTAGASMDGNGKGGNGSAGNGIGPGDQTVERETPARVVVLLTDGEDHEGDPLKAAEELKAAGVRVFTVGLGSTAGEPIPLYSDDGTWTGYIRDGEGKPVMSALTAQAEATLQQVAESTGGTYFKAGDGEDGLSRVREAMGRLTQAQREVRRVEIHEDRYLWLLLPAWLLLWFERLLRRRMRHGAKQDRGEGRTTTVTLGAVVLTLCGFALDAPAQAWEAFRSESPAVNDGNRALATEDVEGALKAYGRAARQQPHAPGVALNLGLAHLQAGDLEKAQTSLTEAARPRAGETHGEGWWRRGDSAREIQTVRRDALYNLGIVLFRQADALAEQEQWDPASEAYGQAADAFRRSLRLQPGQEQAAWNYALALKRARETKEEKKRQEEERKKENEQEENPDQDSEDADEGENGDRDPGEEDEPGENDSDDETQEKEEEPQDGDSEDPGEQDDPEERDKPEEQDNPEKNDGEQGSEGQGSEGQDSPSDGAAPEGKDPQGLPPDVEQVLDALDEQGESMQAQQARQRAARGGRRVEKDW